ncbi:MAG: hypothetical protein WD491_11120 [Balneolales bacterium]
MKNILIRNLSEDTIELLKKKAAVNNRSLQAEVKITLEDYAKTSTREETINKINEVYETYKARKRSFSDSSEDVRSLRE